MTLWVDYSAGEIDTAVLLRAGVGGGIRYGGTPGRTKNMRPGDVAAALTAGLAQAVVYEDLASDAEAGYTAGVAHARALLADCQRCAVPNTVPLCAAADEHLTAAQVSVAVQYQAGFYRTVKAAGWQGPIGAYGFSEFLTAVHASGVADWFWQCGAWSTVNTLWVHLYQRNGSGGPTPNHTASGLIGGVAVDFNDQLNPLPAAGTRRGNNMAVFLKNMDVPGQYATQDGPLVSGIREEIGQATLKAWPGASCEIGLNNQEFTDRVTKSKVLENLGAAIAGVGDQLVQLLAAVKAAPAAGTPDPVAVGQALAAAEGPAIVAAFTSALTILPADLAHQILEQGAAAITKAGE